MRPRGARAQQRRMNSEKIGIRVKVGSHDDDEAANGASTGMNKFLEGNQWHNKEKRSEGE